MRSLPYRIWLAGLLLVVSTAIAYAPAWHGGFIWDDDEYVTHNPLLTSPDGLRRIWFSLDSPSQYFPLVYTTFRIERALWGLDPTGYHWINLLLHIANALLLWRLLTRLQVPGAWLAAAIFALHPVQVESVAWITERKNVLMGFFFLLTLLAWVKFIDPATRRRGLFYALAFLAYLLALSAKTTACTLPAALLLILWLRKTSIDRRRLAQIVPFLLLGLGAGLITIWWERYHVGTRGVQFAIGPIERLLIASRAVWFYLGKLFWPFHLTFSYPRWNIATGNPLAYLWLVAGAALGVTICFARRVTGRSLEVAALFFVATLSPMLGFIMLYTFRYTFVADHYQYLASIGPIALSAAGLTLAFNSLAKRKMVLQAALGGLLALILGVLTWQQSRQYRDIETLWHKTIARNPASWMAYNNLGEIRLREGRTDEAISHFTKALKFQPNDPDVHNNLGNAFRRSGRLEEAISHLRKALELLSARDRIATIEAETRYNLGNALLQKGELSEAITLYRQAVTVLSENPDVHNNLALALGGRGLVGEAIAHYREACRINPRGASYQNNFAWILATCADSSLRDGAKATQLAERANQLSGESNPIFLRTLAAARAENGQFLEAISAAQRARQLADARGDAGLAETLRQEIALYQSGAAYPARSN